MTNKDFLEEYNLCANVLGVNLTKEFQSGLVYRKIKKKISVLKITFHISWNKFWEVLATYFLKT